MSEMRARVLAAAVDVVRAVGAQRATTKAIAEAAGVSEGSIFNHFPTKAALLKAVFTEGIDNPMPAAMARLWSDTGLGDVTTSLTALAVAAVQYYREVLPLSGPQILGADEIRAARAEVQEREFGPIIGHDGLTRYLTVEQGLGRIPAYADPPLLAVALLGGCQQYAFLCLTTAPSHLEDPRAGLTADPTAFAERLINLLIPRSAAPGE
jgi:AcrR family transcriptional regulator